PGLDGLQCLELIRAALPQVKVVMLSSFSDREHIDGALKGGASAYVIKSIDPRDLPSAIRQVRDGTVFH
ncbi:response regulator, partial [Escherichia coli]